MSALPDVAQHRFRGSINGMGGPSIGALGASGNQFLAALSPVVLSRLTPHLEQVHLERNHLLFRAREPLTVVCFPTTAVVSLIARLESGETLDVGLVGRDGLAGTAVVPGITTTMSCDGIVSIPGLALQISADALRRESMTSQALAAAIGRFVQLLLVRSMQMSVCNAFHTVEQRCIRRLLAIDDLIAREDIPLTHEALAAMLGVRRPTVTVVMRSLRDRGLIGEQRSRVRIRDRSGLHAACCECYQVMRDDRRRLLGY